MAITIEPATLLNGRTIPTICKNGFPLFLPSEWLEEIDGAATSPNTARTYAIQLRPLIAWLNERGIPLEGDDGLSKRHLRQYRHWLQGRGTDSDGTGAKPLSYETIRQYMATAVRFARWLGEPIDTVPVAEFRGKKRYKYTRGFLKGILRANRQADDWDLVPKPRKRLPRALSVEELDLIRRWVMAKWQDDKDLQCLYRCIVEVAFSGALRRGELLSLRANSVDIMHNRLQVKIDVDQYNKAWMTGKELQMAAKRGERETELHPAAVGWLNKWMTLHRPISQALRKGHNYLFCNLHPDRMGDPFSPSALRHFLKLLNRPREKGGAGLGKRVTIHVFRHTWATIMLEDGLADDAIQHHLGHSSSDSTRIYAKWSNEKVRKQIQGIMRNSRGYRYLEEEITR